MVDFPRADQPPGSADHLCQGRTEGRRDARTSRTGKLCLNGHEYVKRQLAQRGIAYQALDNGILSCAAPTQLQALCDGLSGAKIEALLRKWLARLPHPFTARARRAGYRYRPSIWQAEFSLTQVLDRPATGRTFFEEVIRENLDLGRPDRVQLIFDRRVSARTPGRFGHGSSPRGHAGEAAFAQLARPARVAGQRVSALPLAAARRGGPAGRPPGRVSRRP
ncbi:MAG: hypothetical protein ACREF4_01825 [Gammaproteobacteria bacterium]